jgi:Spy/CpxP family protein refolding chaperone
MEIKSRIAVGILALAVSCSGAIAQGQAQGQGGQGQNPPPGQQGQMQGPPGGPGGRSFMRQGEGPMGPGGHMGPRGFGGGQMGGRSFDGGGRMGRQFGQRGRMGMRGGRMGRRAFGGGGFLNNPAMRQRLGITSDQATKIHQQDLDFQKSQIRNRADFDVKRIELNELLAADNPDRSAINAKLQEVSAAQMASEKAGIDNRLALRDVLTPAQRTQLQQLRTNGPQANGAAQTTPRAGGRGGAGRGQRGTPPPPSNPQGQPQPPTNQ